MDKYISAEWIRNIYADFKDYEGRDDWTTPISNVLAVIDDAPSIDLVRCKECKYKDEIVNYCYENDRDVNSDDFCSYGERRADE